MWADLHERPALHAATTSKVKLSPTQKLLPRVRRETLKNPYDEPRFVGEVEVALRHGKISDTHASVSEPALPITPALLVHSV
jgi:hypothetical protein